MRTRNVCIALALISATACGGGGGDSSIAPPPPPPPPSGNTPPPVGAVSVTNNAFSPSAKTVAVNTTVQWAWNSCTGSGDPYGMGETCIAHGVNFDDGITSPTQGQGTYTRTFTVAGVYNYHCPTHGTAMQGSITVQ